MVVVCEAAAPPQAECISFAWHHLPLSRAWESLALQSLYWVALVKPLSRRKAGALWPG